MEYKELAKLYHMDASSSRDSENRIEAKKRLEAESTFRLGYCTSEGELFIAVPRELSTLSERVLREERLVSAKMKVMPGIASGSMLRGLVLNEVVSSNLIEGVHSTRRQIKDALDSPNSEFSAKKRFKELATLYMAIIDGTAQLPASPAEVREIYDKVMDGEDLKRDRPDGKLFRAENVEITLGTRVLHEGLFPEEKIIKAIEAMLEIASRDDVPALYSALSSHYLFEYAHPFYDGNGRTGRYLLALYLSVPLSMATALSLSRTIAERKDVYYKAFESAENPLNHGELTHFVYQMLTLVEAAQSDLLKRLDAAEEALKAIDSAMAGIESACQLKSREKEVVYLLMQYEVFGLLGDAPLPEIARYLGVKEQMARNHIGSLEKKGIVEKARKRNPMTFALTEEFRNRFGIVPVEERMRWS